MQLCDVGVPIITPNYRAVKVNGAVGVYIHFLFSRPDPECVTPNVLQQFMRHCDVEVPIVTPTCRAGD